MKQVSQLAQQTIVLFLCILFFNFMLFFERKEVMNVHFFQRFFKMQFFVSFFIVVAVVGVILYCSGDDTQALQNTISSLCINNTRGRFASCCNAHSFKSIVLEERSTWNCFLRDLNFTKEKNLTFLFVPLITQRQ